MDIVRVQTYKRILKNVRTFQNMIKLNITFEPFYSGNEAKLYKIYNTLNM